MHGWWEVYFGALVEFYGGGAYHVPADQGLDGHESGGGDNYHFPSFVVWCHQAGGGGPFVQGVFGGPQVGSPQ